MIESIENFRTSLRSSYQQIYKVLNKLKVGNNNFQTIISEHLIIDENSKPLDLVQNHDKASLPLRIQLKDISGIAANSFGYHIVDVWANSNLGEWDQVLVLPITELVSEDVVTNIQTIHKGYLGDNLKQSLVDCSFFLNTLFIISGCSELCNTAINNLQQLKSKGCNILVLSDATKYYTCLTEMDYKAYNIGLKPSQGMLKFDDGADILIDGLEVLRIAAKAIDHGFSTSLKPGSIIDNISKPLFDFNSDRIVLRGREHKVQHNIKFVIEFEELIQQLYDMFFKEEPIDSITNKYMAIAPNTTKDWFTAATTSDADIGAIRTYNIGGKIIIRHPKNNYLSYGGNVKDVRDNIIGKIMFTFKEKYSKMEEVGNIKAIPSEKWPTIVANEVRKELYKNSCIDVRRLKSADLEKSDIDHEGVLTTVDLEKPDILLNDVIREPSYRELDRRLKSRGDLDFNEMLRMILENRTNESSNIPEELYVLTACFFIAEASRNPPTFLPSLMLLDLAQNKNDTWNWNSIISQEDVLSVVEYDPFGIVAKCYGDFRGMHPMTHDGSYFQSQNICNVPFKERSQLLSLVEYKSLVIILDWLELSCKIKPMESAFKEEYNMEIFPRFSGRLARTSMIDESIDILICEIENKDRNTPLIREVETQHKEDVIINAVTDIIYENELLNHPDLLKESLKAFNINQILDMSLNLDQRLVEEAVNNNDSSLVLAGLVSLAEENNYE